MEAESHSSTPLSGDPSLAAVPQMVQLSECIQLMQAGLIHVNPTPLNLSHPVFDVVMYDPLDEWKTAHNRIILAVGITSGSTDFDELITRAEESDAAAIVVKAHGTAIADIQRATTATGVAVLVAQDDADWTHLVALARASVLGAAADSVSGVRLGDLYAFANAVASLANGAVSIVDPVGRILGYSTLPGQPIDELRRTTTLALQESTPPAFDSDFKVLYSSRSAILVPSRDESLDRLALAVRAGGELLGTIWIIDPGSERQEAVLELLNRLAPMAGLHMLHARSASDFGERRNGDLIRTIMDDPTHASFAAAQLGLESAQGLAVAAFAFIRPDSGSLDAVRELHRLLHLVTTTCNIQFNSGHSALIDSVVYALLPVVGAHPRAAHQRLAAEIGMHSQTISPYPVIAAVGGIARQITDLPASKSEALRTLQHLLRRANLDGEPGTANTPVAALFEDHQAALSLQSVGQFISESGLGESADIAAIRAHDAEQQTDYLLTLRAYLDSNANIAAVAQQLHVHNNTVRYRITRIIEDFDLALNDPTKRLWLWLRLVALDQENAGASLGRGRQVD